MKSVLADKKKEQDAPEDTLRQSLEDFLLFSERLAPVCDDIAHMISIVKAALANEDQLKFLVNVMKTQK